MPATAKSEKATFAAGCFWGVEAAFSKVKGVLSTAVGYTGGRTEHPSYEEVCTGRTGHAEAIEIEFNPAQVSFEEILEVFWNVHNPTSLNRQGLDFGTQYRSSIFYHSEKQKELAEKSKQEQEKKGKRWGKIVTEIVQAGPFYRAEEYHQRYLEKHGQKKCG